MSRLLTPATVHATADAIWLPDIFQPVAARIDPADGRLLGLVDWRSVPPPDDPVMQHATDPATRYATDPAHLWIQRRDRLVCVDADGVRLTTDVPGVKLLAVGGPGAWLAPRPSSDVGEPGHPPPLPAGRLTLVTPDGDRRDVAVDVPPAGWARATPGALELAVRTAPPTHVPSGPTSFTIDYHQIVVALPWEALARPSVVVAEHEEVPLRATPFTGWLRSTGPGWHVDGRVWRAGRLPDDQAFDKAIAAASYDADGSELLRAPLGRGHVLAGRYVHGRLWFVLLRRDGEPRIVTVDPGTGAVEALPELDRIDITDRCWARPAAPPAGTDEHAATWLERLSGLEAFWHPADGPAEPLAHGMSDVHTELDGTWPDLAVQVTFRHPSFADGRLRRRIRLFDELGRPIDSELWHIYLMEDVETGHLPPVSEAVAGILTI